MMESDEFRLLIEAAEKKYFIPVKLKPQRVKRFARLLMMDLFFQVVNCSCRPLFLLNLLVKIKDTLDELANFYAFHLFIVQH